MIDLYTWSTPNGRKASIMLEEIEAPYRVHPIDITKGDQYEPDFLRISPNNKIPAIVDPEGPDGAPIALFESAAIVIYLAEKSGRLLPAEPRARYEVMEWLMFQMGGVGPMFGQAHHFRRFANEEIPYAIDRYTNETRRLYGVLDKRLSDHEHLADDYSIADIVTYPWCARHEWQGIDLAEFPDVKRWYDSVSARPAVARGMAVP
ncbi:MAG: glutathione S-transferase family protein [Alphaproteobacteria bacterium]|nr:glutathione S-transferase family protein [Alphaproteobacteria bacterium]